MENLLPSLTLIFPSLFPTPFVPSLSLSLCLSFPFLKINFCSADEFSCVLPRVSCRAAGAVCVQNREAPHLIPQRAPCTTITTKTLQMHPTHLVLPKVEWVLIKSQFQCCFTRARRYTKWFVVGFVLLWNRLDSALVVYVLPILELVQPLKLICEGRSLENSGLWFW